MFNELLMRLYARLTKANTNWRKVLEPGLKLAVTLRYLVTAAATRTWPMPASPTTASPHFCVMFVTPLSANMGMRL